MALSAKLKDLRMKKRLSLQDLATAVGASKAHIWDLETGRSKNPTIELLTKLSSILNTSIAELVGETPAEQDEPADVLAMWRDLKELSGDDRETIKIMMDRLKSRKQ